MNLSGFDQFVEQEQKKAQDTDASFDPIREKEEWLQYLEELYSLVTEFLDSYIHAGQISVTYRIISLNEEYIGDYTAKEMLVTIGTKLIRLEPVGTFFFGSKGRVDVVGPVARAQLLLMDDQIKSASDRFRISYSINGGPLTPPLRELREPNSISWAWRLVTRPPQREIVELTKETFLGMLLEIANG